MARGVSLANKCQLLFGVAVVLIVIAALIGPWLRVGAVIDQSELGALRDIALSETETQGGLTVRRLTVGAARAVEDGFARRAVELFTTDPEADEQREAIWIDGVRVFRVARPVRNAAGEIESVVLVERRSPRAAGRLFVNRLFLLSAGLVAGSLAVLVFYLITTRIILSPVRSLKETAEQIMSGDPAARADIKTGDEFEQLSDAFNGMLSVLEENREHLRAANQSLDSRVARLEEANLALHEAARLKGDFIAAVSHELRTPLNSIIGFAELLQEIAARDAGAGLVRDLEEWKKRKRYLDHIVHAGRSLLEMINEMLDLAKIEAGKMDLHVELLNVAEACDSLLALIRPQADRKSISLTLEAPGARTDSEDAPSPLILTDPRKFQQIIFNFLSNAVKFTPDGGKITLRAERLVAADGAARIRVSVIDTGPGIAPEDHARIFDRFTQLESGHTRMHTGTGLGLTIARELTHMIQGEIRLDSHPGRGSMFSLIVPERMDPDAAAAQALRLSGRDSHTDHVSAHPAAPRPA